MSSQTSQKVIFFPEGPGYIFVSKLAKTELSKVMIVRSIEDGNLYVRKESIPYLRNPSHVISSAEVRAILQIQHLETIPKLKGWAEYHDELRSNNAVTATYWDIYNAGTLDEIKDHIQRTKEPATERFLFSILRQMMRAMLDTIVAGLLHTDAHASNWFLHVTNGGNEVKVMLGDWGNWKPRSNTKEHQQNEIWTQHDPDFVVQNVRDLIYFSDKANRAHSTMNSQNPETRSSIYLVSHLRVIEALDPTWHQTSMHWLKKLEDAYNSIVRDEQTIASAPSSSREDYTKYRQNHVTCIPSFQDATNQIDWFDNSHRERLEDLADVVHFWMVAQLDPTRNKIRSLEGRPDSYRTKIDYKDHTDQNQLPPAWRQAHNQTQEKLKQWRIEDKQIEGEPACGFQNEASVTGYIDTSMPF